MIYEDDFEINGQSYNRCIELTDWRFSATALGMIRFFDFYGTEYHKEKRKLFYNFKDIDLTNDEIKEKYLLFVENWFVHLMHHCKLVDLYNKSQISEEDKKSINEKFTANGIMKKVFKSVKYGNLTLEDIKRRIESNRFEIILNTFINSKNGYSKFEQISYFAKEHQKRCRLLGFYVDKGRKTRSLGFNFNEHAAVSVDYIEFDFIPFAFSKGKEAIFVNNNSSIKNLIETNDKVKEYYDNIADKSASWNTIFYTYLKSSKFIRQDVEIILKRIDNDYYETVMIRKKAIEIFMKLTDGRIMTEWLSNLEKLLKIRIRITDNYYMDMTKIVTKSILNDILLDDTIESIFKQESTNREGKRWTFCISQLIRINIILYKYIMNLEENMVNEKGLRGAYASAKEVTSYFKSKKLTNKTNSYRQKLTSCIVAKDYDRFIEIMLQLSSYTQMSFGFLHDLIKDFEGNKNLAYEFINSLGDYNQENSKKNQEEE
ncbi:type I CRISPR-associated protein Cas8a1/Csx8 [Eggerthia catenaformis]|nr:type I CRISPR-associated protein Cas8a1/Csx8 [Eggerthia catenaformis]